MGSRMATQLLRAGHEVTVWNRSCQPRKSLAAKGALAAPSPREAVAGAEFVISMLTDDDASRAVWLDGATGALNGMSSDALAVESSTVTPAWTLELAKAVAGRSARFLEAPVVGSRPQAEAGQLVFLLGGEESDAERARPLLGGMGTVIHHAGAVGAASRLKLAVNALFALQVAGVAELLNGLERGGVDVLRAVEIISSLPVASGSAIGAARGMLAGRFEPLFPIALVTKDLRYASQLSPGKLPIVDAVLSQYERSASAGLADENINAVYRLMAG
jgi:3-hydroxyisobutyrate dehydrogenase